jgi:IS605 OrfB family transposase
LAHQIVDLAIQKNKAIAVENLKKLKKGMRGDGKAKLRKILHQLERQKVFAKAKKSSNIKGSGSNRSQSRLHISYWHAKVCTAVKHR